MSSARPLFAALSFVAATMSVQAQAQSQATRHYLAMAGAGDLFERTASHLLLETSRDPMVRDFAREMIRDHTKSTVMVKAAATRAGFHPAPPMLSPRQQAMLAALRGAHGPARDRLYWDQQKHLHAEALTLHQTYATSGDTPALREVAAKIVPVVKHHIAMLDADKAMTGPEMHPAL